MRALRRDTLHAGSSDGLHHGSTSAGRPASAKQACAGSSSLDDIESPLGFKPSHEEEEEEEKEGEDEVFTTTKAKGEFFDPTLPMIELSSAEEPAPMRHAGGGNEKRSAGSRARRRKAKREPAASSTNARDAGAQGVDQAGSGQDGRKDGKGMAAAGRRTAVPAMEEEEEVMEDEGRASSGSWAEGSNVAAGLDAGALAGMFLSAFLPPVWAKARLSMCAFAGLSRASCRVGFGVTRTHTHTTHTHTHAYSCTRLNILQKNSRRRRWRWRRRWLRRQPPSPLGGARESPKTSTCWAVYTRWLSLTVIKARVRDESVRQVVRCR